MNHSASPLRVFIDCTSSIESGGEGNLIWVLANNSEETIQAIRINAVIKNTNQSIPPTELQFRLPPGTRHDLLQFVDLTKSTATELIFELQVDIDAQSGRRYEMRRPESMRFPELPVKGQKRKLTLIGKNIDFSNVDTSSFHDVDILPEEGANILDVELTGSGNVTVKSTGNFTLGNAEKPLVETAAPARRNKVAMHGRRDEDLAEILEFKLNVIEPRPQIDCGLSPLDLEQFALTWPHRKDIYLRFIDDHGAPRLKLPRVDDSYRLLVQSVRDSYLTLIVQGTSGKYYVDASSTWQTTSDGHKSLTLPRESQWFGDPGTERALALATTQALDVPSTSMAVLTDAEVVQLLKHVRALPEASLAFAKTHVEKKDPWR